MPKWEDDLISVINTLEELKDDIDQREQNVSELDDVTTEVIEAMERFKEWVESVALDSLN